MIGFILTFGSIALGTIIPVYIALYLALYLVSFARQGTVDSRRMQYFSALGLGILLYFFLDVTLDSTELGVNSGYTFDTSQIFLVVSFVLGVIILSVVEHQALGSFSQDSSVSSRGSRAILLIVPALVALGIGIHGAGEGSSFAYVASGTTYTDLVSAFGGYSAIVSYVLHKFLEAIIIGAVYFAYVTCNVQKRLSEGSPKSELWEIPILGALLWIPSLVGTAVGYFIAVNPVYFYAFASGASVYAIVKLGRPIMGQENSSSKSMLYLTVLVLIGFLLLYFAALFHSG